MGRKNFTDLRRQVDEDLARRPDGEQIRQQVQRELDAELAAYAAFNQAERDRYEIAVVAALEGREVTVTANCYSHAHGEYEATVTAPIVAVDAEALTLDAADEDGVEARIAWDRITSLSLGVGQ